MRLSAFDSSTGALARRVMALLRECPTSNAQLSQDCLKLLNNLLKRHAAFTPTDAQFRFIVSRAFGDLEGEQREEQRSTTFSLMRAVLARRPLLPEIYDMMKTVSSLVVRANAAETRALCAQALVQFLLDYPLGERRLQQHLEALAANLEYQHAAGRLSALRALRDVIARFPREAVEAHATFLFVPMVARLGADEDAECRRAAGESLSGLLRRVAGTGAANTLLSLVVGWCAKGGGGGGVGDDPRLRRAAMQTLGLAVVAAPADAARAVRAARPAVVSAMAEHDPAAGGDDDDEDDVVRGWQTAYYALLLVEKSAGGDDEVCHGVVVARRAGRGVRRRVERREGTRREVRRPERDVANRRGVALAQTPVGATGGGASRRPLPREERRGDGGGDGEGWRARGGRARVVSPRGARVDVVPRAGIAARERWRWTRGWRSRR